MKTLLQTLFIIGIIILCSIIYLHILDGRYHVSHTTRLSSKRSEIVTHLKTPHQWSAWYPWFNSNHEGEFKFDGNSCFWENQKSLGTGFLKLVYAQIDSVEQQISFKKPFKNRATISWKLDSLTQGTQLTWTVDGQFDFPMTFMAKAMDEQLSQYFELGLKRLDSLCTRSQKVNDTPTTQALHP